MSIVQAREHRHKDSSKSSDKSVRVGQNLLPVLAIHIAISQDRGEALGVPSLSGRVCCVAGRRDFPSSMLRLRSSASYPGPLPHVPAGSN